MDTLFDFIPQPDRQRATVTIDPAVRSPHRVSPLLFSKFCEHLGSNIYNGMDAQILFNPTFGHWAFGGPENDLNCVDGGVAPEGDRERIAGQIQRYAERLGWQDPAELRLGFAAGAALGWAPIGRPGDVQVSPDVGLRGGRAQRVVVLQGSGGIAQRTYLPLHRTRRFEFHVYGRAAAPVQAELWLAPVDASGKVGAPLCHVRVWLSTTWSSVDGALQIPPAAQIDPGAPYQLSLTAAAPANMVLGRILLYPDDHVNHADPDVIRLLREVRLPLLRWPGGNFSSGYHWRDGVGPEDERPTLPNPAWEGLEYNLFGTDEFIAFCRAVGCEPMICINGGNGTPEEAAAWVEYCNGWPETPMGALRAANGHPEPYRVRYWEVGNELDGRWQVSWTTGAGYADRLRRFSGAMLTADPSITLLACGSTDGEATDDWNRQLCDSGGGRAEILALHLLTGGRVDQNTDPAELFHAFMGYASALPRHFTALCELMAAHGIARPRIAVTELQLFAQFRGEVGPGARLSPATMPRPATISEALYDATMIHQYVRLGGQVEMLTHSATVNHGGGLRKTKERVWANPCHYGQGMLRALAGGTPLGVRVQGGAHATSRRYGRIPPLVDRPDIDALAVLSADGRELAVSLVHCSATAGPLEVEIDTGGLAAGSIADVLALSGEAMWDQNTEQDPERITPQASTVEVRNGRATLTLQPYSLVRLTFRVQ